MTEKQLQEILINSRKSKNLTHEEVASLSEVGITRQYYGMIESGERKPSVKVAISIANVLDIDWTIFFTVSGNQTLQGDKQAI